MPSEYPPAVVNILGVDSIDIPPTRIAYMLGRLWPRLITRKFKRYMLLQFTQSILSGSPIVHTCAMQISEVQFNDYVTELAKVGEAALSADETTQCVKNLELNQYLLKYFPLGEFRQDIERAVEIANLHKEE